MHTDLFCWGADGGWPVSLVMVANTSPHPHLNSGRKRSCHGWQEARLRSLRLSKERRQELLHQGRCGLGSRQERHQRQADCHSSGRQPRPVPAKGRRVGRAPRLPLLGPKEVILSAGAGERGSRLRAPVGRSIRPRQTAPLTMAGLFLWLADEGGAVAGAYPGFVKEMHERFTRDAPIRGEVPINFE